MAKKQSKANNKISKKPIIIIAAIAIVCIVISAVSFAIHNVTYTIRLVDYYTEDIYYIKTSFNHINVEKYVYVDCGSIFSRDCFTERRDSYSVPYKDKYRKVFKRIFNDDYDNDHYVEIWYNLTEKEKLKHKEYPQEDIEVLRKIIRYKH